MYRDVPWLQPSDRYILEFMASARTARGDPAEVTPKVIGRNTTVSRKHAGARCRELTKRGLVERVDRGVYQLTDLGQEFVDGELDVDDLRDL
ncbi:hypothetical protein [Natrinema sp. H-ect4]|uniref:hypothetical protein n=1 Tax=Natrinema sp. H-ect4 TaxID=3242699 RepID=UPI0035A8583E